MTMNGRNTSIGWMCGVALALASVQALGEQMTRPCVRVTRVVFNTPGNW